MTRDWNSKDKKCVLGRGDSMREGPVTVRSVALSSTSSEYGWNAATKARWIDALELWCWRRLLRVPWTARRANQSILMEISPEWSLEGLMLKLKLQYFGHLMGRTDSFEKTLIKKKKERKDPDTGEKWGHEAKGTTEDKMAGWHHRLNGHEFE